MWLSAATRQRGGPEKRKAGSDPALLLEASEVLARGAGYSTSTRIRDVTDELPGLELRLVGRNACITCP